MKASTLIGIVLVVLGIFALAYGGFSYNREKTIVDLGPIEAKTETRERVPVPPVLGGLALASGLVLVVMGARQRA